MPYACAHSGGTRQCRESSGAFFVNPAAILVPTLRVGTPYPTLCVVPIIRRALGDTKEHDAERRDVHSHAERGNESLVKLSCPDPVSVERPFLIHPLIRMSAEVVALCLQEVRRQAVAAIAVEICQRGGESGYRQPQLDRLGDDVPPARFGLADGGGEKFVEQQVFEARIPVECPFDVFQKAGADDAAPAPQE